MDNAKLFPLLEQLLASPEKQIPSSVECSSLGLKDVNITITGDSDDLLQYFITWLKIAAPARFLNHNDGSSRVAALVRALSNPPSNNSDAVNAASKVLQDAVDIAEQLLSKSLQPESPWETACVAIAFCQSVFDVENKLRNGISKVFFQYLSRFLDHEEVRVRNTTAIAIPQFLTSVDGIEAVVAMHDSVMHRVFVNIVRKQTHRDTELGNEEHIMLDDTTGWKTLESDLQAFFNISVFLVEKLSILRFWHKYHSLLIFICGNHRNRHIRQNTLQFLQTLFAAMRQYPVCETCPPHMIVASIVALTHGCDDNWSQIRREALLAVLNLYELFLSKSDILQSETSQVQVESIEVIEVCTPELIACDHGDSLQALDDATTRMICFLSDHTGSHNEATTYFHEFFVSRLCLNRFYIAEGVKQTAISIWCKLFTSPPMTPFSGREIVIKLLSNVVDHVICMCGVNNHMVAEAACGAIGELTCRLESDTIRPWVSSLAQTVYSKGVLSESWPIRDAAGLTLASIIRRFPIESQSVATIAEMLRWAQRQLKDPVPSVRNNAATALGELLLCSQETVISETVTFMRNFVSENLQSYKEANNERKPQFIPLDMLTKMTQGSGSQGQAPRELIKSTGWGCCFDCMKLRPCKPWEVSDSCVYIIRELCTYEFQNQSKMIDSSAPLLMGWIEEIIAVLDVQDIKDIDKLQTSIVRQLLEIFQIIPNAKQVINESLISSVQRLTQSPIGSLSFAAKDILSNLQAMQ